MLSGLTWARSADFRQVSLSRTCIAFNAPKPRRKNLCGALISGEHTLWPCRKQTSQVLKGRDFDLTCTETCCFWEHTPSVCQGLKSAIITEYLFPALGPSVPSSCFCSLQPCLRLVELLLLATVSFQIKHQTYLGQCCEDASQKRLAGGLSCARASIYVVAVSPIVKRKT